MNRSLSFGPRVGKALPRTFRVPPIRCSRLQKPARYLPRPRRPTVFGRPLAVRSALDAAPVKESVSKVMKYERCAARAA